MRQLLPQHHAPQAQRHQRAELLVALGGGNHEHKAAGAAAAVAAGLCNQSFYDRGAQAGNLTGTERRGNKQPVQIVQETSYHMIDGVMSQH